MIWTVHSLHARIGELKRRRRKLTEDEREEFDQLRLLAFWCAGTA